MSQITKPMALDETLQDVVTAIQGITQGGMIVSTGNVGSAIQPVYINGGVPTASDQAIFTVNNTFYVNGATGSDSNDGTQAHPFATIQKAVDSCGSIDNSPTGRNWNAPGNSIVIETGSTYAPFRVLNKKISFSRDSSGSANPLTISTSSASLLGAIDIVWGSYVVFNCAVNVTYTSTSRGAISVNNAYCRFTQAVTVVSSGNGVAVSMHGHIFCDNKVWSISCGTGSTNACIYVADGGSFHHAGTITCTGGKIGFYAIEGGIITAVNGSFASGMSTGFHVDKGIISYTGTFTNNANTKEALTVGSFLNGKQIITTGTPTNVNANLSLDGNNSRIQKSGNVVCFKLQFTISTTYTPSSVIESVCTLPFKPVGWENVSRLIATSGHGSAVMGAGFLSSSGTLCIGTSPYTGLTAGNEMVFTGTYMTND